MCHADGMPDSIVKRSAREEGRKYCELRTPDLRALCWTGERGPLPCLPRGKG
jgi:hypothetical protein